MKAIIQAGGLGTRLGLDKPKALIEVKGKPILEHILNKIAPLKLEKIYIVSNKKFYPHFKEWLDSQQEKSRFLLLNDGSDSAENRLGQIGNIYFALNKEKINDNILIISSDNIFDFSLEEPYKLFLEKGTIINVIYDLKNKEQAKNFGVISVKNGKITAFKEKPNEPESTLISVGISFFSAEDLHLFHKYNADYGKDKEKMDKMGYFFQECLIKNVELNSWIVPEDKMWLDIGTEDLLKKAEEHNW